MDVLRRSMLLVACSVAFVAACSEGAPSVDDGTGGDGTGGDGGDGGHRGGKGGAGGKGAQGGGAGGSMVGDAGADPDASTKPPRPEPVVEPYAAPTAKLPVTLDFAKADDLAKNFHVVGAASHDVALGGSVRIDKGKPTILVFDTKPDGERTDTVESFTAIVKYRADRHSTVWFTFAGDKNRNDALAAGFHWDNGRDGPPGVSDVDGVYFHRTCWATQVSERGPDCIAASAQAYGWTHAEPGPTVFTLKITVKADRAANTVKVRSDMLDDVGVIDGQSYTWTGVPRVNGELTIGVDARESDAFIDAVSIVAPEAVKEPSFVTLDASPLHLWVPDNLPTGAKLKGLLHTDPGLTMAPDGTGDFALFEHLRQFARTHGWGLLGGASGAPNAIPAFKADLAKLAIKAGRPEINTVPIFMESLLDTLEYQAVADDELAKRLIGFFANKPRLGGDINAGSAEGYEQYPVSSIGRKVPGFACYSNLPASIAQRTTVMGFWYQQRFFEKVEGGTKTPDYALWTMVGHGPQTHAVVDSWQLYLAFLQELIGLRTKNNDGTTPLAPVPLDGGFLGLYEGIFLKDGQHTSPIEPFAPAGWPPTPPPVDQVSKPQKNFLVGPATALVWQAFQYYRLERMPGVAGVNWVPKRAFWTTVPRHGKAGESRLMKLGFAPDLQWKKIEFFDAAAVTKGLAPLKAVEAGGAPEMNYANLGPGIHNFIARVTGADGAVHLTHPVGAVFAP